MNKYFKILCVGCLLIILTISTSALANVEQKIVTKTQANQAFEYALQYVEHEVAYKLGGRFSIAQYLAALADGKQPGLDIGVDASAVVINAYRSVFPSLLFKPSADSTRYVSDVSSSVIYHYNSIPITEDDLTKGDLVFFKNAAGNIIGVSLFSHFEGNLIHFITASQSAGKVIVSKINMEGNYWKTHFAGYGRLLYAE
ncbi:MAG: C40 family peptidase [Firmicutes bacterium]|nr:C40 family peptidase [Bacillota bacterium]